jgi:hypothetical protein
MNDITDLIGKHISSMSPNSFVFLNDSDNLLIIGLLGDKNGDIWFVEVARNTGEINLKTKKKVGTCRP